MWNLKQEDQLSSLSRDNILEAFFQKWGKGTEEIVDNIAA